MSTVGRTKNFGLSLVDFDFPRWHVEMWNALKQIDAALALSVPGLQLTGAWENSRAMTEGEIYLDSDTGTLWRVLSNHTTHATMPFAEFRTVNPTLYAAMSGAPGFVGAWTQPRVYNVNEIVSDGYAYYVCILKHSSSGALTTANTTYWQLVFDATAVITAAQDAQAAAEAAAASLDIDNFYTKSEVDLGFAQVEAKYDPIYDNPQTCCQLIRVDLNTIKLIPRNGNLVWALKNYVLPAAGVSLTVNSASHTASTLYYVYAAYAVGPDTWSLNLSTSPPQLHAASGLEVKNPAIDQLFVGLVWLDVNKQVVMDANNKYLRSRYNEPAITVYASGTTTTSSSTGVNVNALNLLCFGEEVIEINSSVCGSTGASDATYSTWINENGVLVTGSTRQMTQHTGWLISMANPCVRYIASTNAAKMLWTQAVASANGSSVFTVSHTLFSATPIRKV